MVNIAGDDWQSRSGCRLRFGNQLSLILYSPDALFQGHNWL